MHSLKALIAVTVALAMHSACKADKVITTPSLRDTEVPPGQTYTFLSKHKTLPYHNIKVNRGARAIINDELTIADGSTLDIQGEIRGIGRIIVDLNGTVIISGTDGPVVLSNGDLENDGIINFGTGDGENSTEIVLGDRLEIENRGHINVNNGGDPASVTASGAKITNRGTIAANTISQTSVLNAQLDNKGTIILGTGGSQQRRNTPNQVSTAPATASGPALKGNSDPPPLPGPSPSLITVTGGFFGQSGSVFQVTINNTSHGQLSTAGPVYIYAGTTIKTVVSTDFAYNGALPVILASTIGGTVPLFQYTNPAAPNFKFKRRIVPGTPVKYELYDYPNP